MNQNNRNTAFIFDIDRILHKSMKQVTDKMIELLLKLKEKVYVCIVCRSNIEKVKNKIGLDIYKLDYIFSENGLCLSLIHI